MVPRNDGGTRLRAGRVRVRVRDRVRVRYMMEELDFVQVGI